jgi:cytoskeletal protein RodZ
MTAFTPKKIQTTLSCGQKLKQVRLEKNLSLEVVAQKINIKENYLLALEEDRFDQLPTGLYGRNFIREYAKFLNLNSNEIVAAWQEQTKTENDTDPFSRKIIARHNFIIFPKLLRNLLIFGAVIICFLYLIFYFKKIILPPQLIITYPSTNLSLNESSLTVTGETENEAEVSINGELVLNNNNGLFEQTINLKKGLNNITIKAKKKYSREEIITRQILVE